MSNFAGYLLKATKTNQVFPTKYIELGSWKSTPNQREEINAYRDDNTRKLYRVTAQGKMSVLSFKTRPLHLEDKIAVQNFFYNGEVNHEQRTIQITFWNDEDNAYKTVYCYRPNIEYPIRRITDTDIVYEGITIDLIQTE